MADISKVTIPSGNSTATYDLKDGSAVANITRSGKTFTATRRDGTTFTFTQQDSDTTYSAGTGLSLSSNTFNHSNSVTAGTAGTSSDTSGSTLAVPYVTYDAEGHVTASGTHTHTVSGFLTSSSSLNAAKLTGTVPSSVLPSYVDDVLEYSSRSSFPSTGETGKIYVDTTTNLTYRWGGSAYVEINPSLALGSTASTAAKGNHTHTVIATGNISTTTATTSNKTATVSPASSGTVTYTPAGSVSQPSFTGTAATISSSASYTPAGSIAVNSAGSTTTVNSITAVGTLPTFSTSVADEVLSFSFSQGTLPTKGSNTTVKTGDASYKFTGTATTISSSGSYTPTGSVSQPSFTGTGVRLVTGNIAVPATYTSTFTGTSATTSVPA